MNARATANDITVFDRQAVRRNRERAAGAIDDHDFLFREIADRLAERLGEVKRKFALAVDIGGHGGVMRRMLAQSGHSLQVIETELSPALAARSGGPALVADEEMLPFGPASLELVLSNLTLHWANDLPGALLQIRRALKPDGLFLAAMLGGDTLTELREALIAAEAERTGGASPRIAPFADLADAAALLQRAGFALPVADIDTITVTYKNALALMHDLRGMGETNALAARSRAPIPRSVLFDAAARYAAQHATPDGRLPATFQVLYLTGWAPAETQAEPLAPGSASERLANALGTEERPAGEKATFRK